MAVSEAARHTLVVVRHAKSDWSGNEADHDRPLAARGRRQAPVAGAWLAEHVGGLDAAIVSTAARTRETWSLVAAELADPPEPVFEGRAYAASGASLVQLLTHLPESASTAALVGHNPGVEDLVETLTSRWVPLPTSALAVIGLPGTWADLAAGRGALRTHGRPPGTPQG